MISTRDAAGFDRWVWWLTPATVALVALFVFVGELPGRLNGLLLLLAFVVLPLAALLLIGLACVLAWLRYWRRAASLLLAVAAPAFLVVPMAILAPYVHLGLMLAFDIGYLGPAPLQGQPVTVYDWSTGMVGGPNTFLIHDRTDAIALPLAKSGPAWRDSDLLRTCAGRVQHLIGHYYICFE